ncbi:phage tail tube protein [Novosphingobium olei]|uniref:phage tail tube protein n=1 Tax=Novosphingobium olei TaxID=2728851 RepID=UPI00308537AC|nr:phage tail protein [Novosphingobium olei]
MNAKTSLGAELHMGASSGALTEVAELLSLTPPQRSRETIDATTLSSTGAQEFLAAGIYDPGEVSGQVHYIAGSAGDDAFIMAVTDGVIRHFKIVVKAATGTEDMEFSGFVTAYGVDELTIDGKQTASFTIKVSGAYTQAASA